MSEAVRVRLTTPHWDSEKRLYRPGVRDLPIELARAWGYVSEPEPEPVVETTDPDEAGAGESDGDSGEGEPNEGEPGEEGLSGRQSWAEIRQLPDDFPARDLLLAGGYETVEAVEAASDAELRELKGVGPAALRDIRAAFD